MFARIGIMRALNRHVERVFNPDRKDHHWVSALRHTHIWRIIGEMCLSFFRWRTAGRIFPRAAAGLDLTGRLFFPPPAHTVPPLPPPSPPTPGSGRGVRGPVSPPRRPSSPPPTRPTMAPHSPH